MNLATRARGQRRAEIMIAILFLATAAASIPAAFLVDPILKAPDYLSRIFPGRTMFTLGSLLWSINNIGIVFIAVFAFPVLRTLDESLAVGYLALRIVEGTTMMVGIITSFLLVPLSRELLSAGVSAETSIRALGDMLREARFLGLTAVSLPLLGLGGSFFTWMLFKFRLVQILLLPFWLFFRGFAMPGTKAAGGQGAAWRPTDPRRYPSTWPVMDFSILK